MKWTHSKGEIGGWNQNANSGIFLYRKTLFQTMMSGDIEGSETCLNLSSPPVAMMIFIHFFEAFSNTQQCICPIKNGNGAGADIVFDKLPAVP